MTPLPQQLEDKKKELESLEHPDCMGNWEENQGEKHKICQAEIAILEQAIAEIKKQRQEIIEELRYNLKMEIQGYPFPIYNQIPIDMFIDEECDKIKQQLNQPKTEQ